MAKTRKSGLMARLGSKGKKAFDSHKGDETKMDAGGSLPAGIENAVARLVKCGFGVFQKGDFKDEYFFRAAGVILHPAKHDGVPIEGLQTSIMEPMCKTPAKGRKTIADHLAWVLNELRKLGIDTAELSPDDLESTCEALEEAEPCFRFRTWKGDKQTTGPYKGKEPYLNEVWQGACDYDEDGGDSDVDETVGPKEVETDESNEEETLAELAVRADNDDEEAQVALGEKAAAVGIDAEEIDTWAEVAEAIEAKEGESTEEEEEEEDLASLGQQADAEDEDAIDTLTAKAEEAGLNPDDFPDSWADLVHALVVGANIDVEPPERKQVRGYTPEGEDEVVECEVKKVNKREETCTLLNLDDDTLYEDVSWADLEPDDE